MADLLLYESAVAYALFKVKEYDNIANDKEFQKSVQNYAKFSKYVSLFAFVPFKTSQEALDNIDAIAEGAVHQTLNSFLKQNVKKEVVGVIDEKLATAIGDALKIKCTKGKVVSDLIRGVRTHFPQFVKEFEDSDIRAAMLGLGHSFSRNKVKFNVNKQDTMAVQAIFMLDQLEKDMNTFTMRIKEWYSWHFPELYQILENDNKKFVESVLIIQNRNSLNDEKKQKLIEVNGEEVTERIMHAANSSMGFDVSEFDLANINTFANRVTQLFDYKQTLQEYLHSKMNSVAPNLTALIGDQVGARLLSKAGSLTNLAKCPASTLQILGAEKALFRAIKTRGNTPKYGVIFGSSFIAKAENKNKGRISRFLANKASVAARIDCFSDVTTTRFGEVMKDQIEERMEFLKSGKVPRTNVDVMKTIMEEVGMNNDAKKQEDKTSEDFSSENNSSSSSSSSESSESSSESSE